MNQPTITDNAAQPVATGAPVRSLSSDPKEWTGDDVNEALRRIEELQLENVAAAALASAQMAKIKTAFEAEQAERKAALGLYEKLLTAACKRLRKDWTGKSATFPWGTVRFYYPAGKLKIEKGLDDVFVIKTLRNLGHADAIDVKESVRWEVLETKPADVLRACSVSWTEPGERFAYKTKLEIDAEKNNAATAAAK